MTKITLPDPSGWQPIETAPFSTAIDVWCVYGDEQFTKYDGGDSIGQLKTRRLKSTDYGWFGNQSDNGIPNGQDRDLVPVAWRLSVPNCPAEIIARVLGIPITQEDSGSFACLAKMIEVAK